MSETNDLRVRSFAGAMRAENVRFTNLARSDGEEAFVVDICRTFLAYVSQALPDLEIEVPVDFRYDERGTRIGGYHDYTIYWARGSFKGEGDLELVVERQESTGYSPDESYVSVWTRGLPEGISVSAVVELDTGQGFLDWKGIDLSRIIAAHHAEVDVERK